MQVYCRQMSYFDTTIFSFGSSLLIAGREIMKYFTRYSMYGHDLCKKLGIYITQIILNNKWVMYLCNVNLNWNIIPLKIKVYYKNCRIWIRHFSISPRKLYKCIKMASTLKPYMYKWNYFLHNTFEWLIYNNIEQ